MLFNKFHAALLFPLAASSLDCSKNLEQLFSPQIHYKLAFQQMLSGVLTDIGSGRVDISHSQNK